MERTRNYFVSDVHLGLPASNPDEREKRFVDWLRSIPRDTTKALYLLGDIWDFWYEYRDVVPRTGQRAVAQFIDLMDHGVEVYYFEGNHDIWCFSYFESLGMVRLRQPGFVEAGGLTLCLGHGDALGGAPRAYSLMSALFHSRLAQKVFSTLHPWLAYRIGLGWSKSNRRSHSDYEFRGENEPLVRFAEEISSQRKVDAFVFGHYHTGVDMTLRSGARLIVLKDWIGGGSPCLCINGSSFEFQY